MADLKTQAESRGTLLNFDPRKLSIKPDFNVRDLETPQAKEHIAWLALSIAAEGVREPLTIWQEGEAIYIEDGHCRHAAALLAISRGAAIVTVPCIPARRYGNNVDRVLAQTIHNSGLSLTPLEQGTAFKRAIDLGASVALVAEKTSKSETYVRSLLELVASPQEVINLVKNGAVSASLAGQVVKSQGGPKAAVTLAKAAARKGTKKRVTQKDLDEDDPLWADFRRAVAKQKQRPIGLSDVQIESAWARVMGELKQPGGP